MGLTIWLCVLCLQAGLLSHALDCSGPAAGEDCVSKQITGEQPDDLNPQRASSPLSPFRYKRHVERRGPTHLSQFTLPGSFSVKGFPNTLIQADRARRHLPQSSNKKKNKRKSRVGSMSLLSNDKRTPLQVVRARRQVKNQPPKKGQNAGAYSILGDSQNAVGQNDRPKRSIRGGIRRRRPVKKDVC